MNVIQGQQRYGKTQIQLQMTSMELLTLISWAARRLREAHGEPLPLKDLSGNRWVFELKK